MMRYVLLGSSGLRVSELCLGTMTFGENWEFGASPEESRRIFDAFCERGGNFIDTANTYTFGQSEKLVGEFVASERDSFVISTKFSLNTRPDDLNHGGNHRKSMRLALERSLKQLGTNYIDIYWLHAWDFTTRVDEVLRGLDDFVRSGKVLYIGVSNTPAWVIARADALAELRGWARFIGLQVEYNLIERGAERDLLPMAETLGIGLTAWGPLAGGVLTGKYVKEGSTLHVSDSLRGVWLNADRIHAKSLEVASTLAAVAGELGRTPAQVALNWIRQKTWGLVPIIAARKLDQIVQNLGCLEFQLDSVTMDRLDSVSEIDLGYPHRFLSWDPLHKAIFGSKLDRLDLRSFPNSGVGVLHGRREK
jgi:aryl-alcohol dehydrogenase-like predicted oxidoreductase